MAKKAKAKKKDPFAYSPTRWMSPEMVREFIRLLEKDTARAMRSKAAARAELMKWGMHTKSGRLKKAYR